MLRHVLGHNLEAARDHYAELAEIIEPDCAGQGSQARAALLIERLDALASSSGLALRLRDHGIAFDRGTASRQGGDEADAAAGEQSVRDQRGDAQRLYEAAW